jgi:hypothetical protein
MKSFKYNLLKFTAEFILILSSIILSFYIQGKIDDRESRKEAIHIMSQVRTDMISDTLKFQLEMKNAERLIDICMHLLSMDYEKELATENGIDTTIFFIGETTTNLYTPIHLAGYTRLVNFTKKEVIADNALVDSTISYYTIDKSKIESYYDVDRNFVDKVMIEKYTGNQSYNMLNIFYERNILAQPHPATVKKDIIDFLENKEIRSLLIFNIINKVNYSTIINYTKKSAQRKIASLEKWLEKRSK